MLLDLHGWKGPGFFAVFRGVLCTSEAAWRARMIFFPDFEAQVWTLFNWVVSQVVPIIWGEPSASPVSRTLLMLPYFNYL